MEHGEFRQSHSSVRSNDKLLSSIWIIPSVVLLLAGAVLIWISYDEYQETIEQEYRFLDAHARIAQSQVANLVGDVKLVLTHITTEVSRYPVQQRAAYAPRLIEHNREVPEVRTLAIVDTTGHVEMAANPTLVGFDGSKREYFTVHQDGLRQFDFHISRPYKTVYGDYSVGFSLPIIDRQQHLLGIAVAGVNYTYFDSIMKEIRPAQARSTAAILNDDGDFLYHQPAPEKSVGKNVRANQSFQTFLRSARHTTYGMAVSQTDGLERMYVFRAIGDTPLNIGVSVPVADVLATWRRNLTLRIALFVLGAGVILRLTWTAHRRQQEALAGRRFTDRLIETANAMMVAVDSESRVIAVNEATERITGYRREDLIGRSFFDTAMPRDRFPQAWEAFLHYREGGELPRAFEAPILTRSGEERVIAWQNNGIFAHENELALLSFGVDVTERVQLQQVRNREEVSRRLVGIQDEERRRLAVELHDRTSPNLTVLDINLKLLANSLPKEAPTDLMHLIEDTSATLADTVASIRSVSFEFRPPLLDYAGLWPALSAYARQFNRRTGIAVKIAGQEAMLRLAPDVETNLFHIAQEALTNCARHSHAETVFIRQTSHGSDVILIICDDGAGFDPAADRSGHGLATMRQRAEFIGGKLFVDSHPGKGTSIAVKFSLCAAAAYCDAAHTPYPPVSHANAPAPAAWPLAKHAVSR